MAISTLARDVLHLNEGAEITITEKSAVFGADAIGGDYKVLMLFANAGNAKATVTIAVGDGPLGAGDDLVVDVKAGKTVGIVLDSAYFKQFTGEYKDYYKVTPSAALNVSVIELPQ